MQFSWIPSASFRSHPNTAEGCPLSRHRVGSPGAGAEPAAPRSPLWRDTAPHQREMCAACRGPRPLARPAQPAGSNEHPPRGASGGQPGGEGAFTGRRGVGDLPSGKTTETKPPEQESAVFRQLRGQSGCAGGRGPGGHPSPAPTGVHHGSGIVIPQCDVLTRTSFIAMFDVTTRVWSESLSPTALLPAALLRQPCSPWPLPQKPRSQSLGYQSEVPASGVCGAPGCGEAGHGSQGGHLWVARLG